MEKELFFIKVKETDNVRFYKLSNPVTKAPNPRYNLEEELRYNLGRLKDEYKKYLPNQIEYVSISDATTHIERLMFLAMPMNDSLTDFSSLALLHLDGKQTFLSDGGSYRHVHPDEVYLRRLSRVNGFYFGGIKEGI